MVNVNSLSLSLLWAGKLKLKELSACVCERDARLDFMRGRILCCRGYSLVCGGEADGEGGVGGYMGLGRGRLRSVNVRYEREITTGSLFSDSGVNFLCLVVRLTVRV